MSIRRPHRGLAIEKNERCRLVFLGVFGKPYRHQVFELIAFDECVGDIPSSTGTTPVLASRGLIYRQSNKIAVATEFYDKVQLFTGAHEIGHLVLHEDTVMHRERAFDGSPLQTPRPLAERQGNRFAACFLMPQKLLRERFEFMFCCKGQLRFSDVIAFHLDPINPDRLLYASKDSGERELGLARCTQFNNRNLVSLAHSLGLRIRPWPFESKSWS